MFCKKRGNAGNVLMALGWHFLVGGPVAVGDDLVDES